MRISRQAPWIARADSGSSRAGADETFSTEIGRSISGRFSGAAFIYGGAYLIIFLVNLFLMPDLVCRSNVTLSVISITAAFATAIIVRRRVFSARAIENLAVPFCVLGGLGILGDAWGWETRTAMMLERLSSLPAETLRPILLMNEPGWLCVWILIFPLIVPLSFRRMLFATGLTAAAGIGFLALSVTVNGVPEMVRPHLSDIFGGMIFTHAICVGLAAGGARVVRGLTRDLHRAKRMGSYRLMTLLGKGGMGEVWTARHRMLIRPAAIKLIRPEALDRARAGSAAEGAKLLKRFEREVQATAALASPHTIQVYDFGLTPSGTFYYVMELLRGLDLRRMVERFGPMPPERVLYLLEQSCHSLADAHASGLIHRDVKPANIFACRRGLDYDFVKVLDFGLVKEVGGDDAGRTRLTGENKASGTPAFMPPEMALGGIEVDGRADLYALGCVVYWLLTGRLVFEGDTPMQMIVKHAKESPEPPSALSEFEIPPALDELALACLAKDPRKRPATAEEVAERAAAIARDLPEWRGKRAARWWTRNLPEFAAEGPTCPFDPTGGGPDRGSLDPSV